MKIFPYRHRDENYQQQKNELPASSHPEETPVDQKTPFFRNKASLQLFTKLLHLRMLLGLGLVQEISPQETLREKTTRISRLEKQKTQKHRFRRRNEFLHFGDLVTWRVRPRFAWVTSKWILVDFLGGQNIQIWVNSTSETVERRSKIGQLVTSVHESFHPFTFYKFRNKSNPFFQPSDRTTFFFLFLFGWSPGSPRPCIHSSAWAVFVLFPPWGSLKLETSGESFLESSPMWMLTWLVHMAPYSSM